MDEGTAHLDAAHEAVVNAAIRALGVTRIIIAHRRETIAAADRVLVMANRKLHEASPSPDAATLAAHF
jgi:ATP-binding cassette subfamily B protein RaxB